MATPVCAQAGGASAGTAAAGEDSIGAASGWLATPVCAQAGGASVGDVGAEAPASSGLPQLEQEVLPSGVSVYPQLVQTAIYRSSRGC